MTTPRQRETLAVVIALVLFAIGFAMALIVPRVLESPSSAPLTLDVGAEVTDRDDMMAWTARVVLLFAGAWLLIGMLAERTRLVGRPGAAAARVSWIASTRPWRARESTLGLLPLDRWLLVLVPGALLLATRAVQTSFLSWSQLAIVCGAVLCAAIVMRLFIGRRSLWPILATIGGVIVLRCVVTLAVLSFTGASRYWVGLWEDPARRTIYLTVALALFIWSFVAGGWALSAQLGVRRATGAVLAGVGAGLGVPAAVIAAVGAERVLTAWEAESGLFYWNISRLLDPDLAIADAVAVAAAIIGVFLVIVGTALALSGRRGPARG